MIKWWIALIIGAATMLVGYLIGLFRAYGAFKKCEEMLRESEERLLEAQRIMLDSINELDALKSELEALGYELEG